MKRTATLAGIALCVLASAPARAQAPEDDSGLRANCVGDYFRFCSGYMPGTTAIRACFRQHLASLTPGCRGAIEVFDRGKGRRS